MPGSTRAMPTPPELRNPKGATKKPPAKTPHQNQEQPSTVETLTGAQAITCTLERLGVTDVFGMPGGTVLSTFDSLYDSKLNFVLVRHEQGAIHAAEGYAKATGKVGVCLATSGPGATNLLTGIADGQMDSVPMVAITGQVGADSIGTDAFQEADIVGASMPLSKHSFLVTRAEDIPARLVEAFHIASTGRPGPVIVDISRSAQTSTFEMSWPPKMDLPGYRLPGKPHSRQVRAAAEEIAGAQCPVFYLGGGVLCANATDEVLELVNLVGAPAVTTLTALGAIPDSHPLNMGMPGMHGTVPAVLAMQKADLLINLGARFDDRVTGELSSFAKKARVIHVDIDPAEISKNRTADIPIVGDLKLVASALIKELPRAYKQYGKPDLTNWVDQVKAIEKNYPLTWDEPTDGLLSPQHVIKELGRLADPEAIYVTGVGQHQMWAAQFIEYNYPRSFLSSCGLGTMGFGIPAAMGAKVAMPQKEVWCIDGDGCFQMTNQELATCTINKIPIKVALINNQYLGMVRQWQTLFFDERYSHINLQPLEQQVPNYELLTQAYGAEAIRVTKVEEIAPAIEKARAINDRPVVIEFVVSPDSMVWPMVAANTSNDKIQHALGQAPVWEDESR